MKQFALYLLSSLFVLSSCDKPNAPDCFQKAGKEGSTIRYFSTDISRLILYDYIQIELIPSDDNYIELIGPENLLPEIITEVIDNESLEIRNENTCNFVRSYKKKITAKIYMNIIEVDNYSSGDINSLPIDQPYFQLNCYNSSGKVNLNLTCDSLRMAIHDGVSDVILEGNSNTTYLYNAGINTIDASKLTSNNTFVNSESINSIYTTVNAYFFVSINSSGSVYYKGNPNTIDYIQNGTGKLIHQ